MTPQVWFKSHRDKWRKNGQNGKEAVSPAHPSPAKGGDSQHPEPLPAVALFPESLGSPQHPSAGSLGSPLGPHTRLPYSMTPSWTGWWPQSCPVLNLLQHSPSHGSPGTFLKNRRTLTFIGACPGVSAHGRDRVLPAGSVASCSAPLMMPAAQDQAGNSRKPPR